MSSPSPVDLEAEALEVGHCRGREELQPVHWVRKLGNLLVRQPHALHDLPLGRRTARLGGYLAVLLGVRVAGSTQHSQADAE